MCFSSDIICVAKLKHMKAETLMHNGLRRGGGCTILARVA
jgi:hypothetical protein